jgi:N-acetylglutamate synthase-like GNAT family acetyltransferase
VFRVATWTPADRADVVAFVLAIQRGEFGIEITAADQPDLADVHGAYQAGGGEFWVARADGVVVGTIAAIRIAEDAVALRKMFVASEHRGGSGLAARLMDTLLAWAGEQGVRRVYLGTTAVMNAAHRFYEKHGFVLVDPGELPASFPRMAVDSRFYRLELTRKKSPPLAAPD